MLKKSVFRASFYRTYAANETDLVTGTRYIPWVKKTSIGTTHDHGRRLGGSTGNGWTETGRTTRSLLGSKGGPFTHSSGSLGIEALKQE